MACCSLVCEKGYTRGLGAEEGHDPAQALTGELQAAPAVGSTVKQGAWDEVAALTQGRLRTPGSPASGGMWVPLSSRMGRDCWGAPAGAASKGPWGGGAEGVSQCRLQGAPPGVQAS